MKKEKKFIVEEYKPYDKKWDVLEKDLTKEEAEKLKTKLSSRNRYSRIKEQPEKKISHFIIHEEYEFDEILGINKSIKEMQECSIEELRLWLIQELSTIDSKCWWIIDIGVAILKEKMKQKKKNGNRI